MKRIIPRLFIGKIEDCRIQNRNWTTIHASLRCYPDTLGTKKQIIDGNILISVLSCIEISHDLHLFMMDPVTPEAFSNFIFNISLKKMQSAYDVKRKILVHCDAAMSRSPSIIMLFLAKRLHLISNESYDKAREQFTRLYYEAYEPGLGIQQFLREHWGEIR